MKKLLLLGMLLCFLISTISCSGDSASPESLENWESSTNMMIDVTTDKAKYSINGNEFTSKNDTYNNMKKVLGEPDRVRENQYLWE